MRRDCVKFQLDEVLAMVKPGHVHHLNLTTAERTALDDDEGRLALSVVGHFLEARRLVAGRTAWEPTPLTGETFRRVANRLGQRIGQKKCLRLIRRLVDEGALVKVGSYRCARATGHRVALYKSVDRAATRVLRTTTASVGKATGNKRSQRRIERYWWEHQLFGTYDGLPPPGPNERTLKRWRRQSSSDQFRSA